MLEVFIDEINCVEETLLWWIEKTDDASFAAAVVERLGQFDEIMTIVGQLFSLVFTFDDCNWVVE